MQESELADPYATPRTSPPRGPFKVLTYTIISTVILITIAAASLMIWLSIRPMRLDLDRGPAVEYRGQSIETTRGPFLPRAEQPVNTPEAVAP